VRRAPAVAGLDVLQTPALVLDLPVLEENLHRTARWAAGLGLALRPHAKTHKTTEIGLLQRRAGAVGLTIATVSEGWAFTGSELDDVLVAYSLWVDRDRGGRLRALAERAVVTVCVDSVEGAQALARHTAGAVQVLVEVDSGHHRTGVPPRGAAEVAVAAARAGLRVRGVLTFPGHGYGPGAAARAADLESRALAEAASALRGAGIEVDVLSGGSTPTLAHSDPRVLTEVRPGVYALNDAQQLELGTCTPDQIALTALATVVSRRDDAYVLDAGSKVLGADRPAWTTGYGRLLDRLDDRVVALSEHHATVRPAPGAPLPALGERLRVVPNHVCAAVNLSDVLVVADGEQVLGRWGVAARGANT
jgi:D-serine deaminase-like pyridoxal phosphate-dependent protein